MKSALFPLIILLISGTCFAENWNRDSPRVKHIEFTDTTEFTCKMDEAIPLPFPLCSDSNQGQDLVEACDDIAVEVGCTGYGLIDNGPLGSPFEGGDITVCIRLDPEPNPAFIRANGCVQFDTNRATWTGPFQGIFPPPTSSTAFGFYNTRGTDGSTLQGKFIQYRGGPQPKFLNEATLIKEQDNP